MFGTRWQLFRLLSIPIFVDFSWLVILVLLSVGLGSSFRYWLQTYYPDRALDLGPAGFWLFGLITALAFFGCLLLHELGHALVARHQQLPVRGITLFLLGGVADIGEEPRSSKAELLMALAGPAVSLKLAVAAGLLSWLGYQAGWAPAVVVGLGLLAAVNFAVLVFNLIPAFPLDGGRVLRALLWQASGNSRWATRWAALVGQAFAWLLIACGVFQFFLGNWLGGIWIGLIGLFLKDAAYDGYQQVLMQQALQGGTPERTEKESERDSEDSGPRRMHRQKVKELAARR